MTEASHDPARQRKALRVLLVDDNPDDRALVVRVLRKMEIDLQVEHVTRATELAQALDRAAFDIVITDFQLRWSDGLAVLREVKRQHPTCPVVMFTGTGTEEVAVEAMREGLDDYIIKTPEHFARLPAAVDTALQRMAQREETRLAQERFQTAFDAAPSGIALLDAQGLLLQANDVWCEMFGHPRDDLVGMGFKHVVTREDREVLREFDAKFRSGEIDLARTEQQFLRKYGTTWWAQLAVSAVRREEGAISYFIAQAIDITQQREADAAQRKLDEHLRQLQKLESLGVMAGGIAHDFNNLLTSVIGNAELLRNELESGSRSHARAEQIDKAARRGASLTHQLLAYAGGGRFVVQRVQLSETIDGMKALLESAASGNISVRYDFAEGTPPIEADESQMRQLAINLVTNAAEALGESGGTITIRTGTIDVAATPPDGYVGEELAPGRHALLEVADTGSGIEPDIVARIFEPFFTTKFQGRGLGLSAALGIARSHQGGLIVSTEMGRGTTVCVVLPGALSMAQDQQPPSPDTSSGDQPTTVLVVDPDDVVRDVATAALEDAGFNVTSVANGQHALNIVRTRENRVGLVLLSQMMPGMSGTDVASKLHRSRPDLPIILTSGHAAVRAMEGLPPDAIEAFLQKPFEAAQLVRRFMGHEGGSSDVGSSDAPTVEVTRT